MGAIKLTSSKKAIQFITDEGEVYQCAATAMLFLLNGHSKFGFITPSKMVWGVAPDRFPKSEVYDPEGILDKNKQRDQLTSKPLTTTNDALSVKTRKEKEQGNSYKDKDVWNK